MALRRGTRAARNATDTSCAHLLAKGKRRGCRAKLFENRERLALLAFGSVPREQVGVLIGTTQRLPGLRRTLPVARDFECVGLCDIDRWLLEGMHAPQPRGKLTFHPRISSMAHQVVRRLHYAQNAVTIACKPCGLGAHCRERADLLQFRYRAGEHPRLVEWRTGFGIAAPNP